MCLQNYNRLSHITYTLMYFLLNRDEKILLFTINYDPSSLSELTQHLLYQVLILGCSHSDSIPNSHNPPSTISLSI